VQAFEPSTVSLEDVMGRLAFMEDKINMLVEASKKTLQFQLFRIELKKNKTHKKIFFFKT